jgi:hypothetical protein
MKTLSFILALFVLGLAVMPCTDTMMADHEHNETELVSNVDDNSHNHGDEEDDCPPFCACQCCGIHVFAPTTSSFDNVETKVNDTYTDNYTFNYSYEFLSGIWHPPTVS